MTVRRKEVLALDWVSMHRLSIYRKVGFFFLSQIMSLMSEQWTVPPSVHLPTAKTLELNPFLESYVNFYVSIRRGKNQPPAKENGLNA